jgi:hypothetical protein
VFTVLDAAAAFVLLAVSVHGPDSLPVAAPIYFVCAVTLTWWSARRFDSARAVFGLRRSSPAERIPCASSSTRRSSRS